MAKVEVYNSLSRIWADRSALKELDEATSYPVEGAHFSPAFKNKVWDGREHLLRKSRRNDFWLLPTGLLSELTDLLKDAEWIDCRRLPAGSKELEWVGDPPRDYQESAVAVVLKDRGLFTGRGILNLPIRSGKTRIAAALAQQTGLRTLFCVPSDLLLFQAADAFREVIKDAPVGLAGAGHIKPGWITVATVQTMLGRPGLASKLLQDCDLLIIDEAHHLEGPAWRKLLVRSDSMFKVGLSATVFVSRKRQNNKASIWLKACTGPILSRVSMARLIKSGHLMQPKVLFYSFYHDTPSASWNWQRVVRDLLAQNQRRNLLIARLAEEAVRTGKRVLIDTGRMDQMRRLRDAVIQRGMDVELVHGKVPPNARWEIIRRFQARQFPVLIGTVFGEGIDIPELEVVINAEGQKSAKAAIQRMRNMTPCEGKGEALFIDIADVGQPYLQKHALQRLRLYRGMRGFIVKACEFGVCGRDPLAESDSAN